MSIDLKVEYKEKWAYCNREIDTHSIEILSLVDIKELV